MIKIWRKRWFRKQRSIKRSLRGTRIYSILGRHAFHPHLWKSDKRSIAGGLATGLFAAFVPVPFQMVLAAGGAIFFRVNMPLALIGCWVSNPFTMVPIFLIAKKLGASLLTHFDFMRAFLDLIIPAGHVGWGLREGIYLCSGALILSICASLSGYLAVLALWKVAEVTGHIKTKPEPNKPKVPPPVI